MSDIEERLRDAARFLDELEDFPELQIGAAEEITRLREENARLREALEGWQKWWALPWQDRRPDTADVCWKRSRAAIREGGNDE